MKRNVAIIIVDIIFIVMVCVTFSIGVVSISILVLASLIGIRSIVNIVMMIRYRNNDDYGIDNYTATISSEICEISLLNEEDEKIRTWDLRGKAAMVIGRENDARDEIDVDINLDDANYSGLVEGIHSVINYANGKWYIEDISRGSSVTIQNHVDLQKYNLAKNYPCEVEKYDIVFIGLTRLIFE